jgi:FkbM family methyltransferase
MFPTEHDKEVRKWWSDGGDERYRYDYDLDKNSLVIDLGGYKGQWSSEIYARYKCRILVFEPVEVFAKKIKEKFKHNAGVEVYCMGLGKDNRQEKISLDCDGSSVYRKTRVKETIKIVDVVEFLNKYNIEKVDLMKVNIEGGEYELMPKLVQSGLIKRIKNIQIQFHEIGPDSGICMEKICGDLTATHRPTYQYKFVWENWVLRDV